MELLKTLIHYLLTENQLLGNQHFSSVKQKEERDLQRIEKHLETKREENLLNEEKKERIMATLEYKQLRVIERNREKSEQIRKKNYS